jgi:hypothetical protein
MPRPASTHGLPLGGRRGGCGAVIHTHGVRLEALPTHPCTPRHESRRPFYHTLRMSFGRLGRPRTRTPPPRNAAPQALTLVLCSRSSAPLQTLQWLNDGK